MTLIYKRNYESLLAPVQIKILAHHTALKKKTQRMRKTVLPQP